MNFDDCQQLWSTQPAPAPRANSSNPIADDTALLDRIRADARRFERALLWRDLREIVAALFVSVLFARIGWTAHHEGSPSWPCWLAAAAPVGVAVYLLIDRSRHRLPPPMPGDTIHNELPRALARLHQQARLLHNVSWWYLFPLDLSGGLIALQIFLYAQTPLPVRISAAAFALIVIGLVHLCVARLNRRYLETDLTPRITELEKYQHAFRDLNSNES